MPRFSSEQAAMDAMGGSPIIMGRMRPPGNISKSALKKWNPGTPWKWECGCSMMPVPKSNEYMVNINLDCKTHKKVKGDVK